MSWPTPQEYNEAIQTPAASFVDDTLKKGVVLLNALGLPRSATGAFASVYKVSASGSDWAVRCFLNHRHEQKERYMRISDFVRVDDLDCTVPFHYLEKGIKVKGDWYPIIKMDWVHGDTLDVYLNRNYKNANAVQLLRTQFAQMANELDRAGIAHGDLQHGNIIVTAQGLRLVDYDALFVPALKGMKSLELGHPNYQHPGRNEWHYDTIVDNFSCWLIDASLLAISIDPQLYEDFQGGDDCILFKRTDLEYPETSELFSNLINHQSTDIAAAARLLMRMLWTGPESIPELSASQEELDLLPNVRPALPDIASDALTSDSMAPMAESNGRGHRIASTTDQLTSNRSICTTRKRKVVKSGLKERAIKSVNASCNALLRKMFGAVWLEVKLSNAERCYKDRDYDRALSQFMDAFSYLDHEAFKSLESESDRRRREERRSFRLSRLLTRIAYCYAETGSFNMAHNNFLLANRNANSSADKMEIGRTALLLSLNYYFNNQVDTAFDTYENCEFLDFLLVKIVEAELSSEFIRNEKAFLFFCDYLESKRSGAPPRPKNKLMPRTLREDGEGGVITQAATPLESSAEQNTTRDGAFQLRTEVLAGIVTAAMQIYKMLGRQTLSQTDRRAISLILGTAEHCKDESLLNKFKNAANIYSNIQTKERLGSLQDAKAKVSLDEWVESLAEMASQLNLPPQLVDQCRHEIKNDHLCNATDINWLVSELSFVEAQQLERFVSEKQRSAKVIELITCESISNEFYPTLISTTVIHGREDDVVDLFRFVIEARKGLSTAMEALALRKPHFIFSVLSALTAADLMRLLIHLVRDMKNEGLFRQFWQAYMRNQPVPVAIDQLLQESGDAAPLIIEALIYEGSTLNLIELVKAELSSQADKAHADSNISELLKRIQAVRRTAECGEVFAALIKDDKTAILVAKYLELIAEEDGFAKDLMRNLGVRKLPTESSASRVDNLIASSLKILQESKSEHYFVRLAHLAKENNLKNSFRRIAALTSSVSSSHNDTIMLLRFKHEFGEGDEFENYCGALTLSWTSEALKNLIVEFANGKEDLLAARIAFESLRSGSLNRTALVKLLLRERGLVLTFVYYYYTHYHLPFDDLTQDIIKASSMTTIKSPVDQLFADEYFISIAQASRSLGGRKKVELTKWTAAVNENMITKYGHRIDNRAVLS